MKEIYTIYRICDKWYLLHGEGIIINKLFYCLSCKRVINNEQSCEYCKSEEINELLVGVPVNVIGDKLKGKVFKIKDGVVSIILKDASKNKLIKEYEASKLKKVL